MNKKIFWWAISTSDVGKNLQSNLEKGLSEEEAKKRLKQIGLNKLPEKTKISPLQIFISQFTSFLVWFLLIAAIIAGLLGEWIDAIAISLIVILNAVIGFIQEFRAEKSIEALQKIQTYFAKVIRDGHTQSILAENLVPGDIVLLQAGDRIPADGRLTSVSQLTIDESALTGESTPIYKETNPIFEKAVLADRNNMVYRGSNVSAGKGSFIVTETGMQTEIGKIASLLETSKEEKTPLQIRLQGLGHKLIWICLAIIVVIFLVSLWQKFSLVTAILISLSLAVAAIPEGLPAVVTIALAAGVARMVKRKALVRRLSSIETLGCSTVICTDKTGTLTRNEMVVTSIWTPDGSVEVSGSGYEPEGEFFYEGRKISAREWNSLPLALEISMLCNNASATQNEGRWEIIGDPTEAALIVCAMKAGYKKEELQETHKLIEEIPFDSERKRMSVLREKDGKLRLYVKGAVDILLQNINSDKKEEILKANQMLTSRGLRVLALTYKDVKDRNTFTEEGLTFVGLIAMQDPPREEAKESIEKCKKAGIRCVMITGDHEGTASAIAKELGLSGQTMNGKELETISDEDLKNQVKDIAVYARVSAEHKIKIIKAWKSHREIVAMTGDGVNDAPAIKQADIGVGMGISGTDVTKEVSDLVILDDNFASIVNAVEEGRGIYNNIIKFVLFLLSANLSEIFVIFIGMFFGFLFFQGTPFAILLPVQLLWINLVTDGFPAIALGIDPPDPMTMQQKPKKPSSPILTRENFMQLLGVSLLIAIGTLFACYFGLKESIRTAQTMTFSSIVVLELIQAQIFRSQYGAKLFANIWFPMAIVVSFALQLAVIYFPFFQPIFKTVQLGFYHWMIISLISIFTGSASYIFLRLLNRRRKSSSS